MCSCYILEFTGQTRCDLIVLCQNLNKTLKIDSGHSNWVEFPPISQLFLIDYLNEPGIMNASQTSMFYDPLCASIVPDPGPEFHELLTNAASTVPSISYNEPLPLMFLRFESPRLWKNADGAQERFISLGIVILRKLLQATQQLSILYQQDSTQKENKIFCIRIRRNASDNVATVQRSDDIARAYTSDNMKKSPENAHVERCAENEVLVEMRDILSEDPKPSQLQKCNLEAENTDTRLSQLVNSTDNPKLQPDWDNLSKETLSFCITYICNFLYQVNGFHKYLRQTDKNVLVFATLRALELSRYRTDVRKRDAIDDKEHAFLQSLELLFDFYMKYTREINLVSTELEMMYMEKLCLCNTGRVCFFDSVVPLALISFLVKRQLTDYKLTHEEKRPGRNLALYTLCHSNKPLVYYTAQRGNSYYNTYYDKNCCLNYFKDIVKGLLDHIKDLPESNLYLAKY